VWTCACETVDLTKRGDRWLRPARGPAGSCERASSDATLASREVERVRKWRGKRRKEHSIGIRIRVPRSGSRDFRVSRHPFRARSARFRNKVDHVETPRDRFFRLRPTPICQCQWRIGHLSDSKSSVSSCFPRVTQPAPNYRQPTTAFRYKAACPYFLVVLRPNASSLERVK